MNFKNYAAKLNDVAQATFTEILEAEATFKKAEERQKSFYRVPINDHEDLFRTGPSLPTPSSIGFNRAIASFALRGWSIPPTR